MKRFWILRENDQYAVYDSKEKNITNWVHFKNENKNVGKMV